MSLAWRRSARSFARRAFPTPTPPSTAMSRAGTRPTGSVPEPAAFADRRVGGQTLDGLANRFPRGRMDEVRIQLEQRQEHERAPVRLGMRDLEVRLVDRLVVVEEEIEIDRARAPPLRANAPHALLDQEELPEELARLERRLQPDDRVQEGGLVHFTHGIGVVERGDAHHQGARQVAHGFHRFPDEELAVPQVGSHAHEDLAHDFTRSKMTSGVVVKSSTGTWSLRTWTRTRGESNSWIRASASSSASVSRRRQRDIS